MEEIWKDIEGYKGFYQVSNQGKVRSLDRVVIERNGDTRKLRGKSLALALNPGGYYFVNLSKNSKTKSCLVSRLVAKSFVENPMDFNIVDHIDDNPRNNNYKNLNWCTQAFNIQKAHSRGRVDIRHGENVHTSKLNEIKVLTIITLLQSGNSGLALAKKYKVSPSTISNIKKGITWQHLTRDLI